MRVQWLGLDRVKPFGFMASHGKLVSIAREAIVTRDEKIFALRSIIADNGEYDAIEWFDEVVAPAQQATNNAMDAICPRCRKEPVTEHICFSCLHDLTVNGNAGKRHQ